MLTCNLYLEEVCSNEGKWKQIEESASMTTSAPQWPGQEGMHERREQDQVQQERSELAQRRATPAEEQVPRERSELAQRRPTTTTASGEPADERAADAGRPGTAGTAGQSSERPSLQVAPGTARRLQPVPNGAADPAPVLDLDAVVGPDGVVVDLVERRRRQQRLRRAAARRNRFVVVRDAAERDLWAARRRARASLPSPVAVTRDIALALLEVEAGCRSAAQLERIFSPRLWEALEHRIGRRGGPLPSGRSLMSVRCQEDRPGLADTVAVVQRGELVRPVALRLDACGGRWTVTELRWWRNETDTAVTPGRDGGSS
jgi:hypothetical protein